MSFTVFRSLTPLEGHVSGVVDFIECIWFGWDSARGTPLFVLSWESWPLFNPADSLITVGMILLIPSILFRK